MYYLLGLNAYTSAFLGIYLLFTNGMYQRLVHKWKNVVLHITVTLTRDNFPLEMMVKSLENQ
jgi:membrane-anchored protein YejM (alkaline phosphatase superfamily)